MMANLGMADTLILMVLALVVFGPRRLPKIGRQIGKLMYEFRKASNDFKFQMEEELRQAEEADRRKKEEEERNRALAAAPAPPQLQQSTTSGPESPIKLAETIAASSLSAESPYADQIYPEGAAESRDDAAPQPSSPRILPPSTGEKVAAERPGTQSELVNGNSSKAPESVTPEAERSEPAAHHAAHNATHHG
jgi:sec-independent protein translocase protein TatB